MTAWCDNKENSLGMSLIDESTGIITAALASLQLLHVVDRRGWVSHRSQLAHSGLDWCNEGGQLWSIFAHLLKLLIPIRSFFDRGTEDSQRSASLLWMTDLAATLMTFVNDWQKVSPGHIASKYFTQIVNDSWWLENDTANRHGAFDNNKSHFVFAISMQSLCRRERM